MALEYRFRDRQQVPIRILQEIGVKSGMSVLHFGCGPGSFTLAAAQMVGIEGQVSAVDTHPLTIKSVERATFRGNINNVRLVVSDDIPGVSDGSIDVVLLYDVLHHLSEPTPILTRFDQLLASNGALSVRDHRLSGTQLIAAVTANGLFGLLRQNQWAFQFKKLPTDKQNTFEDPNLRMDDRG
jgi:ubiquinone/menaquinone biosynthesis C-methylase UbiE